MHFDPSPWGSFFRNPNLGFKRLHRWHFGLVPVLCRPLPGRMLSSILISKQHTIAALQPPAPSRGEPIVCRLASPAVPRRRGESLLAEDHSPALFSWRVLASPSDSAGQDPRKLSPASSQWPIPDPRENPSILGPSRSRECRQIRSFAPILCGHGLPLQIAQLWLGQRVP